MQFFLLGLFLLTTSATQKVGRGAVEHPVNGHISQATGQYLQHGRVRDRVQEGENGLRQSGRGQTGHQIRHQAGHAVAELSDAAEGSPIAPYVRIHDVALDLGVLCVEGWTGRGHGGLEQLEERSQIRERHDVDGIAVGIDVRLEGVALNYEATLKIGSIKC